MLYEARSSGWRLARPPSARPSTFGGLVCLRNVRPLDTRLAIFAKQNLVKNRLALVKELLRKCENMRVLVHKSAFWVVLKGQNTKILRFFAFLVTQGSATNATRDSSRATKCHLSRCRAQKKFFFSTSQKFSPKKKKIFFFGCGRFWKKKSKKKNPEKTIADGTVAT